MHSTIDSLLASSGAHFSRLSARRLLVVGGIGLILVGMIFGDIFAVFVLHQNATRVGAGLGAGAGAAFAGDGASVVAHFQDVGSLLENHNTKIDTHVNMIGFGYLAFLLAVLKPWLGLHMVRTMPPPICITTKRRTTRFSRKWRSAPRRETGFKSTMRSRSMPSSKVIAPSRSRLTRTSSSSDCSP